MLPNRLDTQNAYRPDIDGLRAVAVLAVVFYHFNVFDLRSGFVGVDIFFVISGYLITRLIAQDMWNGGFSFSTFFVRRIKRILPALLVVLIASGLAGTILLLPTDLKALGDQSAHALFGMSNFYFFFNSGYFDQSSDLLPLLHTWSLGVEEQFYLLWPAGLFLTVWKFGRSRRAALTVLAGICVISVAFCIWFGDAASQAFSFYLLPCRAWQLGVGGMLAFAPAFPKGLGNLARGVGAVLVIYALAFMEAGDTYPNSMALIPTLGAALLVWPCTAVTTISRALSLPPFLFFGRISYSLYLWHWPVIVYFRIWSVGEEPDRLEKVLLFAFAVACSAATWRFVEQPARRANIPNLTVFRLASLSTSAMLAFCAILLATGGLPERLDPEARKIATFLDFEHKVKALPHCYYRNIAEARSGCIGDAQDKPKVALFGDSHARHFLNAMVTAFPDVHFTLFWASGCKPVPREENRPQCNAFFEKVIAEEIPKGGFSGVILSSRWRWGAVDQIPESLDRLMAHTNFVYVFGQTMEYKTDLPRVLLRDQLVRKKSAVARASIWQEYPKIEKTNADVTKVLASRKIRFFSPFDAICRNGSCRVFTADHVPFARDYGHLTDEGALEIVQIFKSQGLALP